MTGGHWRYMGNGCGEGMRWLTDLGNVGAS